MYLGATGDYPSWEKIKNLAEDWLIVIFSAPVEFHLKCFYLTKPKYGILRHFVILDFRLAVLMSKKRVTHLVRNEHHLNDPFIHGQIDAHIRYKPSIVFKYPFKSGSYKFTSDLEGLERLKVGGIFNYYYLKKLWRRELHMVRKFLKEQRPDILHLHYGTDAYIYTDVMRDFGIPSVVSFYGYDASSVNRELCGYGARLVRNGTFANATKILAMSLDMKEDLLRMGCPQEKVIVHYFGVATKFFSNLFRVYRTGGAIVKLLMIASMVPQKGHYTLIHAVSALRNRGLSNFHLTLVGEGELRDRIISLISERDLNNIKT